jgi:tRNA 2-selenouridine synthase
MGEQVLDLEGMGRHLGSAFGRLGQTEEQPTSEFFANLVAEFLTQVDSSRPVFVEDEGSHLGSVQIPVNLYRLIRSCPRVFAIRLSQSARIKHLCATYTGPDSELENAIHRITKRLGNEKSKLALEMLDQKNHAGVAEILLDYYDKRYAKHLYKGRQANSITSIDFEQQERVQDADFPASIHLLVAQELASRVKQHALPPKTLHDAPHKH